MQCKTIARRPRLSPLGAVWGLLLWATGALGQVPEVRFGILMDGPWFRNQELCDLFAEEIRTLLSGEFIAHFPADKRLTGDWTLAGIEAAFDRLLSDPDVDLVLAMGALVSSRAASRSSLPKPVIAPFVVDQMLLKLPQHAGGSGVPNLTYLQVPEALAADIGLFRKIVPFDRLVFLLDGAFVNAHREECCKSVTELGLSETRAIPVFASADDALGQIPEDAEAVYLSFLPQLEETELQRLIDGLIERRLPSFSYAGRTDVERGVLAGTITAGMFDRRARRVALAVQQILLGTAPERIPVAFAAARRLALNMATARAIGVSPPWEIYSEADLIGADRKPADRLLTLAGVMREAVTVNLDLAVQRAALGAGAQDLRHARSALLPQLDLAATATVIDKDRAAASLGQITERTYSGRIGFSQLLFAEPAWANVAVQGHRQRGREQELAAARLDVIHDAAAAYLSVLAANKQEQIQKNNVQLTRENLELARVRVSVGAAGPAEVYRWEAELAAAQRDLIQANAQRNLAEMELNRVLHRPLEEPFELTDLALDDPAAIERLAPPFAQSGDRRKFRLLRGFYTSLALRIAPEIQRLDAALAAQERNLQSKTRQYYAPTVGLQGGVENVFARRGAGAEGGLDFGGLLPPDALPAEPDDINWQIGVSLSLPLFAGGARIAAERRARAERDQLRRARDAAAERIEQRVRSALHLAGASHASIRLTREAAAAAARTLAVVVDAYGRGAASILDLLDARNAALAAEEAAAIAAYQFLQDYMGVQRAVGRFELFLSPAEAAATRAALEAYLAAEEGTQTPR